MGPGVFQVRDGRLRSPVKTAVNITGDNRAHGSWRVDMEQTRGEDPFLRTQSSTSWSSLYRCVKVYLGLSCWVRRLRLVPPVSLF